MNDKTQSDEIYVKCTQSQKDNLIKSLENKLNNARLGNIDGFFSIEIMIDEDKLPFPVVTNIFPKNMNRKQGDKINKLMQEIFNILRELYIKPGFIFEK